MMPQQASSMLTPTQTGGSVARLEPPGPAGPGCSSSDFAILAPTTPQHGSRSAKESQGRRPLGPIACRNIAERYVGKETRPTPWQSCDDRLDQARFRRGLATANEEIAADG